MTRYFRNFYGSTASIRILRPGAVRLTVRSGQGRKILSRDYGTYQGARIALGKFGDSWTETTKED